MENLKIKVNSETESKEVQELFFELGAKKILPDSVCYSSDVKAVCLIGDCVLVNTISFESCCDSLKEITLPELRDLVVLKRNSIDDATHEDKNDPEFKYRLIDNHWHVITEGNPVWRKDSIDLNEAPLFIKPIEKPMKEYLRKNNDGEYILEVTDEREAQEPHAKHWIEVPSGMNIYWKEDGDYWFTTQVMGYCGAKIIWQRTTHPEELPFIDDDFKLNIPEELKGRADLLSGRIIIDDEPLKVIDSEYSKDGNSVTHTVSLNDQYAEIETVRQSAWQKQEGGRHYKNLKIQPMQYALENKLDYAQANVVKYVTRHKEKNGKEDLLKAIHNLELMIEFYYGDEK